MLTQLQRVKQTSPSVKPRMLPSAAAVLPLAMLLVCSSPLGANTYYESNGTANGYAGLDSRFGGNDLYLRAGDTWTMNVQMGTYGGTKIDYGTSLANTDEIVSGPWWLNSGLSNLGGSFGPDDATVRFVYRGDRLVYFHVTYWPSYAEINLGFFTVHVAGCSAAFSSLPSGIAQGDSFTAVATGSDDNGRLSSVTLQISINGGPWNTLTSAGAGNGWSSSTPLGSNITAEGPGTTYQFRTWAIDNNGYQSRITTSGVYTTVAAVPLTGYQLSDGTDLNRVFKGYMGGAKAAPTGITCVVNGTTYDLSDLFQPRTNAPRANTGFLASNGSDLAAIFDPK
jgi:hypothetical protein